MDIYRAYELLNQPQLSVEALVQIATDVPEYQVYVAAHPSATVELLQWLGQSTDPNVVAAVTARLAAQTPGVSAGEPPMPDGATWESPVETSSITDAQSAASSAGGTAAVEASAVAAKKSLGGGAITGIIVAGVAVAVVIGLMVDSQVGRGSVFGAGSVFGGGVSREQGCDNLRDALLDYSYEENAMTDQYMEEMFSGNADFDDIVSGMGNLMAQQLSTVSGKIGNREVREVWDEYVDVATSMGNGSLSSDSLLGDLEELMRKENEILLRLDGLCPGLQYELPTY